VWEVCERVGGLERGLDARDWGVGAGKGGGGGRVSGWGEGRKGRGRGVEKRRDEQLWVGVR